MYKLKRGETMKENYIVEPPEASCAACGTPFQLNETPFLLCDESPLCPGCVSKVRLLYPLVEGKNSADPLRNQTLATYQEAAKRAYSYREELRKAHDNHSAVFVVDKVQISRAGLLKKPIVYAFGHVLYGTFFALDTVLIQRKKANKPVQLQTCLKDHAENTLATDLHTEHQQHGGDFVANEGYEAIFLFEGKGLHIQPGTMIVKD